MEINMDQFAEECIQAINSKISNLKTLNIIVAGKTGVGKSTLLNSVFRQKMVETGIGRPVTQHMRKISKEGFPLSIYDTKGFELGKNAQQEVKKEIISTIKESQRTNDINQYIHCIWYCISTTSHRIEPEEIEWIRDFSNENRETQVPIIIVLTQAFSKKDAREMRNFILNENMNVTQVIPVLAQDYEIDDDYVAKAYGMDELISVMGQVLPSELIDTLQNVQKASLKEKKKHAHSIVATAVTAAFAEGFSPIPFSDAAVLIPTQVGMIAGITACFGLDIDKAMLTIFVSSTIGSGGATVLGKNAVTSLLKLIPGAGTIIGGMISGSTAGILTTALGEAYIALMEKIYLGEIKKEEIGSDTMQKEMNRLFKEKINENKKIKFE